METALIDIQMAEIADSALKVTSLVAVILLIGIMLWKTFR